MEERRRGRHRGGLAALLAGALVLGVVGALWLSRGGDPSESDPSHAATPSAAVQTPVLAPDERLAAMVDGDTSFLDSFARTPGERTSAAIWRCADDCRGRRQVLAVLEGERRELYAVPRGVLQAAGGGRFVVDPYAQRWPRLYDLDGEVRLTRGPEAPAAPGEVLVGMMAVDPEAATVHPVPAPTRARIRATSPSGAGQLAVEAEDGLWITADGGRHWRRTEVDLRLLLTMMVPSAVAGEQVVLRGGDGATLFPLERIDRVRPDGTTSTSEVSLAEPYVVGAMVRADGRLLLATVGPGLEERPSLLLSTAAGLHPLAPRGFAGARDVQGTALTPRGPLLVAQTADLSRVLVSSDGERWRSARTR